MMFTRKKFVLRAFSVFGILTILNGVVYPTVSYALTSGPHQPEYTSYEDASATDMVNLATGDFTFNTTLLTVPVGSSGGFAVPLSYHAGIGPDQEASWVGLGWNINPGSVTRDINGFPDDANADPQTVAVQQLNIDRGWTSQFLGSSIGWDSNTGHYGTIDLSAGFGVGLVGYGKHATFGMRGLSVSDGKVNFNAKAFALTVANAALTVATWGESSLATTAFGTGSNLLGGLFGSQTPDLGPQGYWAATKETRYHMFHSDYWVNLKQSRVEDMYGVLNLDKASTQSMTGQPNFLKIKQSINGVSTTLNQFELSTTTANKGAASDINTDLAATTNYWDNTSPALLAYDNFNVNGPGVSGSIKPYRLETGSVSVPREMSTDHIRLNPVPYLDYGTTKVPFVYEGAMGNNYFNHVGGATYVGGPTFYDGITSALEPSSSGTPGPNTNYLRYDLNDVTLASAGRLRTDVATTKRLPQGHFVDWKSNLELKTTGAFSNSAYMDYFKGTARDAFRSNFTFGGKASYYSTGSFGGTIINFPAGQNIGNNFFDGQIVSANVTVYHPTIPNTIISTNSYNPVTVNSHTANSISVTGITAVTYGNPVIEVISNAARNRDHTIGAFVITDPSGMNYHYALPAYDYSFFSKTWDKADPTKLSTISRTQAFANTWLLTAITGPDFVDRGGTNNVGDGYIDENDWGYWIKFNYGKAGDSFNWATPYNKQKPSSDDLNYTFASGKKEKYFLNSIETRSHVALFIKGSRSDRYDSENVQTNNYRLDEIALITKDAYNTLVSKYHMKDVSGRIDNLLLSLDYTPFSFETNFLQASSLKRILFNYDDANPLCPGVPTSPYSGKLTLKSYTVAGSFDSLSHSINKVLPDMKFEYGSNPSYDQNKWDGWGMYSSTGTSSGLSHKVSTQPADGSAWSLTKITNPEGSEILLDYERDTYNNISGSAFPASDDIKMKGSFDLTFSQSSLSKFVTDNTTYLNPGTVLNNLSGNLAYKCVGDADSTRVTFSGTATVSSINGNEVTLSTNLGSSIHCSNGQPVKVFVHGTAKLSEKKGGNLRVKTLTLNDPSGQSYVSRYLYSNGTVAVEPDYIRSSDLPFYSYLKYPNTPVLYGQVTVLNGKQPTASDYDVKTVYNFITPNTSQYVINTTKVKDKLQLSNSGGSIDYSSLVKHQIEMRTGQIGKVTSIETYELNNSTPVTQTTYTYTDAMTNSGLANSQGVFSEGTLLFEAVMQPGTSNRYHRAQRTTALSYPFTVQKVVTTTDGFTAQTENKDWDPITGAVLETRDTSPQGLVTQTITVPAYTKYSELASKAIAAANKNMLAQNAATYVYRLDGAGKQIGLVGANATTWKKDWANYRVYNPATVRMEDNVDATGAPLWQVWRENKNYSWNGSYSRLQVGGTQSFSTADLFNFTAGASNTGWQFAGSKERYDHSSNLLETRGPDNIYVSTKMGYLDQLPIATATNARYDEMAYSGAEDAITVNNRYFGGEVHRWDGIPVSSPVHTGSKALSLFNNYGFVYKTGKLQASKTYKASAWANSPNGKIVYILNGSGTEVTNPPQTQTQVGSWYRIDCIIPTGTTSIQVMCKATNGAVVFDDFRFQPLQSSMTTYVYDPTTRAITYSLDNDNLYTRFEYSKRGILIKTYKEGIQYGGERLISESKDDYKRFHTNQ